MWALRRAPCSVKLQGVKLGTFQAARFLKLLDQVDLNINILGTSHVALYSSCSSRLLQRPATVSLKVFTSGMGRELSSQAANSVSSSSEDAYDDDDPFSELEGPVLTSGGTNGLEGNEDGPASGTDISDDDDDDNEESSKYVLGFSDAKTDPSEKLTTVKIFSNNNLLNAIVSSSGVSVEAVMNNWVEQGKDVLDPDINAVMFSLRKRRMFDKALQFSQWLEMSKKVDFVEDDYASRVDLIAKVGGVHNAERYIESIPPMFRGEVIYLKLLANCVATSDVNRAEKVFNKMKDLGFQRTAFACNQMLILYKRLDKNKIPDVLSVMEQENVKPNPLTYKLLIDAKGQANDLTGMNEVVAKMNADGLEPDLSTLANMAKHYVHGGLTGKAEAILKKIEGGNLEEHRLVCRVLFPLYAALGKAEEVGRVWKVCESSPYLVECVGAIEAWGKLNRVHEAELVFATMEQKCGNLISSRQYSALLNVYANNKMVEKGKELVRKMKENKCKAGPLTWDAMVKLYVEAGEVEQADSLLHKAVYRNKVKPIFRSYMMILDCYSKRGDVHNAEKIFFKMRKAGYAARPRQFQALVQTYINGKVPAYGMRERMKADNIFPTKALMEQLAKVDAFRRSSVSGLLDE
ncbi:Pentatricopeptide repeat-containing protein At1g80270, mitochondrial [Linum grandiflorum]